MHFEGRLCQQNSRIPVFVRKLFVYFVIRKEIEHKNVKRQVLELLSANGSLKKSQPIRRQMRFDCLQNIEILLLFQGLAATHNAICEWFRRQMRFDCLQNIAEKNDIPKKTKKRLTRKKMMGRRSFFFCWMWSFLLSKKRTITPSRKKKLGLIGL